MSDQEFNQEQDKAAQEEQLVENIGSPHEASVFIKFIEFFIENGGSAFAITAISNRLEEIIKDTNELEYAKENLQMILNKMGNNGIIDTVGHSGEIHYLIREEEERPPEEQEINGHIMKIAEKKAPEVQKINLEPIKQWLNDNRSRITGWLLLLGILVGLVLFLSNVFEILISLSVIFITVIVLIEIRTASKQSEENLKYHPPIYGIFALVFDVIGLIILITLSTGGSLYLYGGYESLYVIPILIVAILSGVGGFYIERDNRPVAAMLGLFLGGILLMISLWPLLYTVFGFIALLYH